jgi:signal transduction histidine kinase
LCRSRNEGSRIPPVVHRNSLRLLKMVNALLDFSRIEAGRMAAVYAPTDIAALTAELASVFRSAVERAGMRLIVDCPPVDEAVFLDRDLWEKIVLNLLSNAFKFTFEGQIEVSLRHVADRVELTLRDTGVGISAEALPHIFERFHRVEGGRRRSYEGTGIGLALVQELTKLHGGVVHVESAEGRGTTFTIAIPTGSAHLPQHHIRSTRTEPSTSIASATYADEAVRWLPNASAAAMVAADLNDAVEATAIPGLANGSARRRVLLADDNAESATWCV